MTRYVALLRAVNVGGRGKLAMADLKRLCEDLGFCQVRTYIASGNVVFASDQEAASVRETLQARLASHMGKPAGVVLRTAEQMAAALRNNPFAGEPGQKVAVLFSETAYPEDVLDRVSGLGSEKLAVNGRELYVFYPDGMGRSRLVIASAAEATARNLNTVAKLAEISA